MRRTISLLLTLCSIPVFAAAAQDPYYVPKCLSPYSQALLAAFAPGGFLLVLVSPSPGKGCKENIFSEARLDSHGTVSRNSGVAAGPSGVAASRAVAADFNGDGVPDLALTEFPGSVSVSLGNGIGDGTTSESYHVAVPYAVGNQPFAVVAADVNGDGVLDLVTANNGDGTVSVLLGNGDGTFKAAKSYPAGSGPASLAIADVTGDGKPDVVVAGAGAVSLLAGIGDGSFRAPVAIAQGNLPETVVIADFNKDGKLDIAYGDIGGSNVYVALGTGAGQFAAPVSSAAGVIPNFVGYGDFNGDGKLDIVALGLNASILSVSLGQGNGQFGAPALYAAGIESNSFALADVTGDGLVDLLTADMPSGYLYTYAGKADGSFAGPRAYPAGPTPSLITSGDFNGDGDADFAVGSPQSDTILVYMGDGEGGFGSPVLLTLGDGVQPTAMLAADFNHDGKADLVLATSLGIGMYLGEPGGLGSISVSSISSSGAVTAASMAAADFNGDGKLDLAVAGTVSGNGEIAVYFGDGQGGFQPSKRYTSGISLSSIVAADLNGDGKPDLAATDYGVFAGAPGGLMVLFNQGAGTFGTPSTYAVGANPRGVAIGDLNGDGKPDLAVATTVLDSTGFPNGSVAVLLGSGLGNFGNPTFNAADAAPFAVAIGDFDQDGLPDVLASTCCGGTDMNLFSGNGDGTLQAELDFAGGPSPQGFAVADFNGDGKPDVAVAASAATGLAATGDAVVLLNLEPSLVNLSAAGGVTPPLAPNSIVSAYGMDLATGALSSGGPSSNLLGTTVTVQDSTGAQYAAQLFYVSAKQVNYLMPAQTASGTAIVTVTSGDGKVSSGTVLIAPVAPSLFTENANNLAAMVVVDYGADNSQTVENVYTLDSTGAVAAAPITLGSASDQVYVSLYGTGIRGVSNVKAVNITLNGTPVQNIQFAGAQPQFAGEDQVNFQIPYSFKGAGTVDLVLTVDGVSANSVTLVIQ